MWSRSPGLRRMTLLACIVVATVFLADTFNSSGAPPPPEPDVAVPAAADSASHTRLAASLEGSMDEFLGRAEKRVVLSWIRDGAPESGFAVVQPILQAHCVACHNADTMPRLSLTTYAEVVIHTVPPTEERLRSALEISLLESMAEYIEDDDRTQVIAWLRAGAREGDYAAVEPILEESCAVCHNAEDMPELPLTTYAEVAPLSASAGHGATAPPENGSPLHPTVRLLDAEGRSVLQSGGAVSTIRTCGQCHDSQYIAGHSYHVTVGLDAYTAPGQVDGGHPWDTSPGLFGRWDPLTYRVLTASGDPNLDIGTADWIRLFGGRHVGGGPAAVSREGRPLTELSPSAAPDPETHVLDEQSGEARPWDWQESGIVEMNCFLCHISQPDNDARRAELQAGAFRWAATATLARTGLVRRGDTGWEWNASAFTATGGVPRRLLGLGDPRSENCGLCHGTVTDHPDPQTVRRALDQWRTETTGQIFSSERLADSGLAVPTQDGVSRPWDIHAQRLLECTSCHYSLNNPAYRQLAARPDHLRFDARRTDIGEYLKQPSHQFAKGQSAQGTLAPALDRTMRRCESCHNSETTHDWLPYRERHMNAMTCEACHIPRMYAPARRMTDWTLLGPDGEPQIEYRGVPRPATESAGVLPGYEPVLLPRRRPDGRARLTPYNLITIWYWVSGEPERPVRLHDLRAALFVDGAYHPALVAALDGDADGTVAPAEQKLDTTGKVAAVRARLEAVGVTAPRIRAEIQPFSLHHNVAPGPWATRECQACHGAVSRITRPITLASYTPGGVLPELTEATNVQMAAHLVQADTGVLTLEPEPARADLYILGHDRWATGNRIGALAIVGVSIGVAAHGALRILLSRRLSGRARRRRRVPK